MWNRVLGLKPLIPRVRKHPEWHIPVTVPNERFFADLTVLRFLLKQVAPHTAWKKRLLALLILLRGISEG
jgi:hypothetical protein